jgi:CDP-diacylglycerol--serine O-phosphatidyltransferase
MKIVKWIPSVITLLNLSCGVLAILQDNLWTSCLLLILAGIFDLFDGLAARLLNAQSLIGKELDSLADTVSFVVAPAILYFSIKPDSSWLFYIPIVAIAAGGVLRLAIFNVSGSDKNYFLGMATPATAFMVIGILIGIHFNETWMLDVFSFPIVYILFGILLFSLNLIPLKMFSIKSLNIYPLSRWLIIALLAFLLFSIYSFNYMALFLSMLFYVFLSVIFHIFIRKA